ncbi:hypothetical protein ABBQ38_008940 [Trebouxia sp. C0009 RCD-2024]
MSSEGVTKVDLQKHTPSKVTEDSNSELDKEDFQKAAQDAKDSVSDTLQSAKEFVVGESNDAEEKTKSSQGSAGDNSLQSLSDDLISNELDNIHSQQDVGHSSEQPAESGKGAVNSAREQTASAVDYAEGQLKQKSAQEDPEVRDFKNAAADTAHSVKESVKPDDQVSGKSSSEKTVMESVTDAAAAVYNKIVPSAKAKESEARQHLHRAGDAAEHAGQDLKTSAHELKEAVTDSARGYGRAAQDRANNYGHEARAVSPADSQVEDIKDDLDRSRTRVRDQAEGTFQEGKEKSQNWWNKLFGGGKERAEEAADYGRERARAAQDRLNRTADSYPSGGEIRREGRAAWENAKDATVDSGRYLAGRASAIANGDTRDSDYDRTRRSARGAREDVKDGYQDAKNNARGAYYDAKDGVKESYDDAKDSVKDTWNDAKHSVQDTYNDAKDSVRDTKRNVKDKYNETSRDISRNIEHAKQSWQDSLTPHSYFEDAWSKGEIPSNTEDVLRSRGVYSVGSPDYHNESSDAQASGQGKAMRGEDFLRQTEYGYGEENLGADDLSELRAAADGHGPYAKYN